MRRNLYFFISLIFAFILTISLVVAFSPFTKPTITARVTQSPNSPTGWLDNINSEGVAGGWVTDADYSGSLDIHFYVDGQAGSGTFAGVVTANQASPDVQDAGYGNGNNRYSFTIPSEWRDGQEHTLYAHVIGVTDSGESDGDNPLLSGVPKSFTLQPATQEPITPTPPVINSLSISPSTATEGSSVYVSGSVSAGTSCIAKHRFYVLGSEGGAWSNVGCEQSLSINFALNTSSNARNFYSNPGTYTLRWEVQNSAGQSTYLDRTVTVNSASPSSNAAPIANIVFLNNNLDFVSGNILNFSARASDPENRLARWRIYLSTNQNPVWTELSSGGEVVSSFSHRFAQSGTYTWIVEAQDREGSIGRSSTSITITPSGGVTNLPEGSACSTNSMCSNGLGCVSSICRTQHWENQSCASNDDCLIGSGLSCISGICRYSQSNATFCTDSDSGLNYNVKGRITRNAEPLTIEDGCIVGGDHNGWLREAKCSNTPGNYFVDYNCSFGCSNGACLQQAPLTTVTCTDSDGGIFPKTAGFVRVSDSAGNIIQEGRDNCDFSAAVNETYCQNGRLASVLYACTDENGIMPTGCSNGACTDSTPQGPRLISRIYGGISTENNKIYLKGVSLALTTRALEYTPEGKKKIGNSISKVDYSVYTFNKSTNSVGAKILSETVNCRDDFDLCIGYWPTDQGGILGTNSYVVRVIARDWNGNIISSVFDFPYSITFSELQKNLCREVIQGHNKPEANRANLVFVGYFNETEPDLLKNTAAFLLNNSNFGLFSVEPFKSNNDKFNFWYVDMVGSLENCVRYSDAVVSCTAKEDLAGHCIFPNKYTTVIADELFNPYVSNTIHLSPYPGGTLNLEPITARILRTDNSVGFQRTFVHEFGHLFAHLNDEYITGQGRRVPESYISPPNSNCYSGPLKTKAECLANAPWKSMIGNGCGQPGIIDCTDEEAARFGSDQNNVEVSCFEGCGRTDFGTFRPTSTSIMRSTSEGGIFSFGPWNEKLINDILQRFTGI